MKTYLSILFLIFSLSLQAQNVEFDWTYTLGGRFTNEAKSIKTDAFGNVYVYGSVQDTVDLDPGPGSQVVNIPLGQPQIFIQKLSPAGQLLWAHAWIRDFLGDTIPGELLHIDDWGNVYLAGLFSGTIDIDPGPNTVNLTSASASKNDIFLVKLDPNGNFKWATQTGGSQDDRVASLTSDQQGNLYMTGNMYGSVDFDPGAGTFTLVGDPMGDAFIQKLDSSGNFVWAKEIGNTNFDGINASVVDRLGNLILSGSFVGSLDIDPGVPLVPLNSTNNTRDIYILKLDAAGDFLWANSLESSVFYEKVALEVDAANEILLSARLRGTVDLDPGPNTMNVTTARNGGMFLQKLDQGGNLIWANTIGDLNSLTDFLSAERIDVDKEGNIYVVGGFAGNIDFNPGLGVDILSAQFGQTFIVSYNPDGTYLWGRNLDVSNSDVKGFNIDVAKNIALGGRFSRDFDVDPGAGSFTLSTSSGSRDMFMLRWKQDSCSGLAATIDRIDDPACGTPGLVVASAVGGSGNYSYSWNTLPPTTKRFIQPDTPGTYVFTVTDDAGCSTSTQAVVGGPNNLRPADLNINVTSTDYRPGRSSTIWVDAYNDGCAPLDGEVVLILDPFLTYTSAFPPPDSINGQTLIWFFNDLNDTSGHFLARVHATVSTTAGIGDEVCIRSAIRQKGGGNNTKFNNRGYCRDVINSYDPNDKRVFPEGVCEEGYIENDEWLTYTLRFQNTGNASAIDIFLLDTLDVNLDMSSFRVVGQSHEPMITEALPDRVMKFRFDNIYLPDSTSDEPNSHGYVIFEILPLPNLPDGTQITNSTSIYFDFNKPVKTNTVLNTVTDSLPQIDTTFLQVNTCGDYTLNGRNYTESGSYLQVLSRDRDCDSAIVLNLQILPDLDTTVSQIGSVLTANAGGAHGLDVD
ncbi:MAG: SBBP repeat-containing protein, partial [Bacteroidota bacterium]